jgi:hypothetical protein
MTTIHMVDELDDERRQLLHQGDLALLPPTAGSRALVRFAAEMLGACFAPFDPVHAQRHLDIAEWVRRFAAVKPVFMRHEVTAQLVREIVEEVGCDTEDTFWDIPRLRGVTSDGYLTAGVGYAHHPHRDTWYSAPPCQLNWWMPLTTCTADNALAFHPEMFDVSIENTSGTFDYYLWNQQGRRDAAKHITSDTRPQPKAVVDIDLTNDLRVVGEVGSLLVFSAAHLHSTVPNTSGVTRFSLDFRTVSQQDLEHGRGPTNGDSMSTGTSLRDFHRCRDGESLPAELIHRNDRPRAGGTPSRAHDPRWLVFEPEPAT